MSIPSTPPDSGPPYLSVQSLSRRFGEEEVLHSITFNLGKGHSLGVLGRSGSGKTTLLRILAGLESADEGQILLEGSLINNLPTPARGIVYLNQEPLLFPHMDVAANIGFGLKIRGIATATIKQKVEELLADLDLESHAGKRPEQLSGGQRQRAAFGRAVILRPHMLLLDEPFANLDAELRAGMQTWYRRLADSHGMTTILVTHDIKEALIMGHQIAVLDQGRLNQFDSKSDFVRSPFSGAAEEIEFWNQWKS